MRKSAKTNSRSSQLYKNTVISDIMDGLARKSFSPNKKETQIIHSRHRYGYIKELQKSKS